MKKFFYGAIALLSVSLIFFACSTDSDEPETPKVPDESTETTLNSGAADAAALEAAFAQHGTVKLASGVTSVDGLVPDGKTLVVEATMPVTQALSLEVLGTLQIAADAVLDASYVSGASGYLKGATAVAGTGSVKLPYFGADATVPSGAVSFVNVTGTAVKIAGSYNNGSTAGGAVDVTGINALFALEGGPDALTATDIAGITATTVPANKTLTLLGTGNTTTALDLTSKGTLVVEDGAVLEVTTSIIGNTTTDVQGTLKFAASEVALSITGIDLSNATIDASAAGVATLTLPTAAQTVKAIVVDDDTNDLSITGATELRVTSISGGKGIKSDSITKYATSANDFIALATAQDTLIISSVANNEFAVETGSSAVVIGSALTFGGAAKIKTIGTGSISVTGVTGGYLPLTTANLANFVSGSKITISDAATGADETLIIPEGVEVVAASAGLETITGLTVNGTLTAGAATLAAVTALTVNGTLTVGTPVLTALTVGTNITGTGELIAGALADGKAVLVVNSTLAKATIATTGTITGNLTIPQNTIRTLTGAAVAPAGDVTVETDATLNVANGAELTMLADKTLTISGVVALDGTGSVVLTSGASSSANGAKLDGAGKLTAQSLEISGAWEVKPSDTNVQTVTIASTATAGKATITGSTQSGGDALLVGGTTGRITQKAGTNANALTLTTVTIDVSANGEILLIGADSDGANLVLVAATAIIKGAGDGSSVTVGNIAQIGTVVVSTSITIGASLDIEAASSPGAFEFIKGAASANNLTAKKTGDDVSLSSTTTLTYT
jgi:hypothetical protein